jgi:hypothetical protein
MLLLIAFPLESQDAETGKNGLLDVVLLLFLLLLLLFEEAATVVVVMMVWWRW